MKEQEYDKRWTERESRYPGWRRLAVDRPVHIHVNREYANTYAGQVAALTAVSLLGRMSKSVAIDVPPVRALLPLPWASSRLDNIVMCTLQNAHPNGIYEQRKPRRGDRRLAIGPRGHGLIVHGCGWGAYCGGSPSPITPSDEANPFGAVFAVIVAASRLQLHVNDDDGFEPALVDTYFWKLGLPPFDAPKVSPNFELGELWCVGVGSVGSCALFFLTLATRGFDVVLVDRDVVKVENVTRSALFSSKDGLENRRKADVVGRWLNEAGVRGIERHIGWLDEIPERWRKREAGTPDIMISAANERNVRFEIENYCPPLQVYSTTGRNWQATLFRHIPMSEACSLCVPGGKVRQSPTLCATGSPEPANNDAEQDDVALPFLSYAAGLMAAAEIAKLALTSEIVSPNRVFFEPRNKDLIRTVELRQKQGCMCQHRDAIIHEKAIRGSRFAPLTARPTA